MLHLFEERLRGRRILVHQLAGKLQVDRECDEVLLRPLVQVKLDPAAVGIGSKNEPRPGRAQLGDLGAQPLELVVPRLDLIGLQNGPPVVDSPRLSVAAAAPSSRPALARRDGSLPPHSPAATVVPPAAPS